MKTIITLETTRTDYSAEAAAARRTMTVADLMAALEQYDDDALVVFSNDNGYTFGAVTEDLFTEL